jgi:hypothetical protein
MIFCENCGEEIVGGKFVYSSDYNDSKKFCSKSCAEQYYRSSQASPLSSGQKKQAWITFTIGVIIFVLIIGIIGGTLNWLFKRKSNKRSK